MNIKDALTAEHSKKQTLRIAAYACKSKTNFAELMKIYFSPDRVLAQRASWAVSVAALRSPEHIRPYLKKIISHLQKKENHDAVIRNGVKILENIEIPKSLMGAAADLCFRLMRDPAKAIAIRCYAMTTLSHLAQVEPELKNEIMLVINDQLPFAGSGFRSRARRTLKELEGL
jgi:hypothetical protein